MRLQVNINIDGAFTLSVVEGDPSIPPPWAGSLRVNPVPWTYVRGFGALPLQEGRNIHPVPTVLDRGRIVLSRRSWNGVHPRAYARG
ncbi:MAG: hypothetical protein O7G28_07000, partial [Deltaproteobacteria bacterium]|nr:hypothetical protein [Deltaproteobacteria bacterium]